MNRRPFPSAILFTATSLVLVACEPKEKAIPPVVDPATVRATPGPGQPGGPKASPKPGDWMFDKYKNPLEVKPGEKKKK